MKAIALRSCKWNCGSNSYVLVQGQEVDIDSTDLDKAKASKLFEIIETKPTRRKKAE